MPAVGGRQRVESGQFRPGEQTKGTRMRAIQKKAHANFSPEEASRAIYVDFEGFKDKTPSLVGILVEGVLTQIVLDPRLFPAAVVKGCKTGSIREVAHELGERCQSEGRTLVAYSGHELRTFATHSGVDFSDVYRNALLIARKWWNVFHHGKPNDRKLKTFLTAIGAPMPASLGVGNATLRLRAVINMLERRHTYGALTPVVRKKWRDLLAYNAHDCRGTQRLMIYATKDFAARSRAAEAKSNGCGRQGAVAVNSEDYVCRSLGDVDGCFCKQSMVEGMGDGEARP
jgi:hypothetical protein